MSRCVASSFAFSSELEHAGEISSLINSEQSENSHRNFIQTPLPTLKAGKCLFRGDRRCYVGWKSEEQQPRFYVTQKFLHAERSSAASFPFSVVIIWLWSHKKRSIIHKFWLFSKLNVKQTARRSAEQLGACCCELRLHRVPRRSRKANSSGGCESRRLRNAWAA